MNCFWLRPASTGRASTGRECIELPYFRLASAADMWTGKHDGPESVPTKALQFFRHADLALEKSDGQRLIFVLAGRLKIPSVEAILSSGDTLLLEPEMDPKAALDISDDCLLLVVHIDGWAPKMISGDPQVRVVSTDRRQPNFKWLFTGADGEAYFADFTEIFDENSGWGTTVRTAYDTMLIEQADGFFMDWHPEGANNLVVITYGCLELEAAPDRIERFFPGDVCFAVDRTGKGHIDRAHGATGMATIVIPSRTFKAPV